MKTSFNTIYLPVKNNITGDIMNESHSENGEVYNSIRVVYDPDRPVGKYVIYAVFRNNNQGKRFYYGKTRKEIKALINDINDFKFDPHLFLNQ